MQQNLHVKNLDAERSVHRHARKHQRGVGKQLQPINFMLFLKNLIFLRKLPLIKLQIYSQTGQAKSNNSSKHDSMAALIRASNLRSKSAVNVVRTRPLKNPQPISGF